MTVLENASVMSRRRFIKRCSIRYNPFMKYLIPPTTFNNNKIDGFPLIYASSPKEVINGKRIFLYLAYPRTGFNKESYKISSLVMLQGYLLLLFFFQFFLFSFSSKNPIKESKGKSHFIHLPFVSLQATATLFRITWNSSPSRRYFSIVSVA